MRTTAVPGRRSRSSAGCDADSKCLQPHPTVCTWHIRARFFSTLPAKDKSFMRQQTSLSDSSQPPIRYHTAIILEPEVTVVILGVAVVFSCRDCSGRDGGLLY
eukprot:gene10497-2626_t